MTKQWQPESWRKLPARHQIPYDDPDALARALRRIATLPPVVFPGEVDRLKAQIAEAGAGRSFLLHGGDCVERFEDCNRSTITDKIKILLQMSVILTYALRKPVVKIGRIAGQYFKPRSAETEDVEGEGVLTYRGDPVHRFEAAPEARRPDPERLVEGYFHAAATLNYIRAMIHGGFADLHNPYTWKLHFMEQSEEWEEYRTVVERILDAISFMESFGGVNREQLGEVEFFTSHEGLHLDYESALTRRDEESGRWYNLAAHMVWLGERTRSVEEAHVEYFRGIANPIGIKIGPSMEAGELEKLLSRLDPDREAGRITLITRLGAGMVTSRLPELIRAVREHGSPVVWSCDPMHGNSRTTATGVKTRRFEEILAELNASHETHRREGSRLSGVHFELTGENVTECTGGVGNLKEEDLGGNYRSFCDPRLNYAQSLETAFQIGRWGAS
ncbi:MAG: 3-deoxy-7-phosphoheptulonate synthase class II, partial [Alkalispirochaetaceae bacterium]